MKTLVVIPTFNEKENLAETVHALFEACRDDVHALIVDDSSPDGTGKVADELVNKHNGRLQVIHREEKLGLGSAYLEGFRHGLTHKYAAICEMDADGSHDPRALPSLLKRSRIDKLVIGSRYVEGGVIEGWGLHRKIMSSAANGFARRVLRLRTRDVSAGFRCYGADVAKTIVNRGVVSSGYAFQEEALYITERVGMEVIEVPITFRDRKKGRSKLSLKDIKEFVAVVLHLRKKEGVT